VTNTNHVLVTHSLFISRNIFSEHFFEASVQKTDKINIPVSEILSLGIIIC